MLDTKENKKCPFCKEDLVVDLLYTDSDFIFFGLEKGKKITEDLRIIPVKYKGKHQFIDSFPYCPNHLIFFNVGTEIGKYNEFL